MILMTKSMVWNLKKLSPPKEPFTYKYSTISFWLVFIIAEYSLFSTFYNVFGVNFDDLTKGIILFIAPFVLFIIFFIFCFMFNKNYQVKLIKTMNQNNEYEKEFCNYINSPLVIYSYNYKEAFSHNTYDYISSKELYKGQIFCFDNIEHECCESIEVLLRHLKFGFKGKKIKINFICDDSELYKKYNRMIEKELYNITENYEIISDEKWEKYWNNAYLDDSFYVILTVHKHSKHQKDNEFIAWSIFSNKNVCDMHGLYADLSIIRPNFFDDQNECIMSLKQILDYIAYDNRIILWKNEDELTSEVLSLLCENKDSSFDIINDYCQTHLISGPSPVAYRSFFELQLVIANKIKCSLKDSQIFFTNEAIFTIK